MSKDIVVLTPNGRRATVHCTPDTNMLQILEDVCTKHGFQPSDYNLKHHNKILDLSSTMRFSNLPNKACLEMVEAGKKRTESNVTIGLTLDDGERRTADFAPGTTLFDLVHQLAGSELKRLNNPAVTYMRQDVVGINAMKEKTLRQMGLLGGRAVLRLFNKPEEAMQANVSAIYKVPIKEEPKRVENAPCSSKSFSTANDPLRKIKEKLHLAAESTVSVKRTSEHLGTECEEMPSDSMEVNEQIAFEKTRANIPSRTSSEIQAHLERRLKIEEEVTFIGENKAVAYTQPESGEVEVDDLPDDFYNLTVDEVRKLYHELHKKRIDLENRPLLTSTQKDTISEQSSTTQRDYNNAVVRVQFPDRMVLQGVFKPTDTIQNVIDFIKLHLATPNQPFHIFTTPIKESLDPKQTLLDARFVPGVHVHFNWLDQKENGPYLKKEIFSQLTASDAASILASKYRAPTRHLAEEGTSSTSRTAESSLRSKIPKWLGISL